MAKQTQIRQLTYGNKTGDAYGITIPRAIALQFLSCYMTISQSGNSILIESGAKI
jgi:hypothetical protein